MATVIGTLVGRNCFQREMAEKRSRDAISDSSDNGSRGQRQPTHCDTALTSVARMTMEEDLVAENSDNTQSIAFAMVVTLGPNSWQTVWWWMTVMIGVDSWHDSELIGGDSMVGINLPTTYNGKKFNEISDWWKKKVVEMLGVERVKW